MNMTTYRKVRDRIGLLFIPLFLLNACAMHRSNESAVYAGDPQDISGVWWIMAPVKHLHPADGDEPPLRPEMRLRYQQYEADLNAGRVIDRVSKYCLPEGVPRIMTAPYPFEIVQTEKLVTFLHESHHTFRVVHMDEAHPVIAWPTFMGDSIGRWVGNTLVIDSIGFSTRTSLDVSGLPHSDKLRTLERFHKTDDGKLQYEVMIDDPATYTRQWTAYFSFARRPDVKLRYDVCGEKHRSQSEVDKDATSTRLISDASTASASVVLASVNRWTTHSMLSGIWGPAVPENSSVESPWKEQRTVLQPWALAEMEARVTALREGRPLPTNSARCLPDGFPAFLDLPYNFRILQTDREIIFLIAADYQWRRVQYDEPHPDQLAPSWWGHSSARWDGDELVIDTIGLTSKTTVNWFGLPHTDQLHVIERYKFTAGGDGLHLTMTMEDPGAYVRPWTIARDYARQPEERLEEYVCAENNQDAEPPSE